jgi:endonuclease YncB( thermonuclease family)
MKRLVFVALLAVLYCALPVRANTLQAIVVEVNDGKTIIVENTGRRIKVVLKAAEAPEKDQPYGDVARLHLAGFVLNRQVVVEYTGLGVNSQLIARVFFEDRDIGLQMIRDGVAWFDRNYETELGAQLQRLYADSEHAARSEHRGIWQDSSPVPPWEWRRAKADNSNRETTAAASPSASAAKGAPATNEASSAGTPLRVAKTSGKTEAGKWPLFSSSDNLFSVRMPGGAQEFTAEIGVPHGQPIKATFRWVHHLKITYLTAWASGPYQNEVISALFDRTVDALNDGAAAHGLPCEFFQEKDTSMGSYKGRQYKVRGCYLSGAMRNYFKVEGKTLNVIFVGVMSEIPDNPEIREFMESLTINQ